MGSFRAGRHGIQKGKITRNFSNIHTHTKKSKYSKSCSAQKQINHEHYKVQCNGIQQVTYFKRLTATTCIRGQRNTTWAVRISSGLKNDNKIIANDCYNYSTRGLSAHNSIKDNKVRGRNNFLILWTIYFLREKVILWQVIFVTDEESHEENLSVAEFEYSIFLTYKIKNWPISLRHYLAVKF